MAARFVLWLLAAVIMIGIFVLSAQEAESSDRTSGALIVKILHTINPDYRFMSAKEQARAIAEMQGVVRALAHIGEYFVLGAVLYAALRSSGLGSGKGIPAAFFICVLYALSDEVHQYFVPGRSCQLQDIIADSCGALAGVLLLWLCARLFRRSIPRA